MPRVLLAPDKFKGTLTSAEVAAHLGAGIRSVRPDVDIVVVPVSDGGDGLLDAATRAGFEAVPVRASGPTGSPVDTSYVRRGDEAVIEMAEICGLVRLPEGIPAPMTATSRGVGEVIAAALDAGCEQIMLGIGGSASTDGGAGMLRALGARLLDGQGDEIDEGGGALAAVAAVDLTALHPELRAARITVACDVDNPLTGSEGAAAVYGPQKGATPDQIHELDGALSRFADVVATDTGRDLRDDPGAGAAGGVGFGAIAVLGARLRPGADVVQDLTGLEAAMAGVDLVVTGEGALDKQTLHGKAPAGVAAAARRAGLPVVAVAGRCVLDAATLRAAGIGTVYALTDFASYPDESFVAPGPLLERVGAKIATHDMIRGVSAQPDLPDLVIRAQRAIVDGAEISCSVVVSDGQIVALEAYDAEVDAVAHVVLGDDEVLLPGLVDTHVHVNEPGRTEWEGFASATRAAAAGGVTTIIDMPLNSVPPTTTLTALRTKQDVARDQIVVDVGFWGGAVPGNLADLSLLHEAGVFGFKCFLIHSGVDEFAHLDANGFAKAMDEVSRLGALMLVHAEHSGQIDDSRAAGASYAGFLASRPPAAEQSAIAEVIAQAERTGARTHLLHLSSAAALPALRRARAGAADLTVETCPHYLVLDASEVPDGATEFKCCPPIRDAGNREQLWAGLADGDIDMVVSDHSPSTPELKWAPGGPASGDFAQAWGGIASLQVSLPAVWTAARVHGHSLTDVVRWMAQAPADRVGLTHKGRLAVGADADLVVLAPDEEFDVDVARLAHKNPVSAYAGRRLSGVVRRTWLRGIPVTTESAPHGRFLQRGRR
ncbi:MAG: allantoinase AllB [Nocardioides sp.]|nr:allantoinase AllB [Nocardioides sp.]